VRAVGRRRGVVGETVRFFFFSKENISRANDLQLK